MVPVYNGERDLGQALRSVLAADLPHDTQIEVVDDQSSDRTDDVAASFADDGVSLYVNPTRLGAPENFNECIRRATGRYVHILHADDWIKPDFYRAAESGFSDPAVLAVVTRAVYVGDDNHETNVTPSLQDTGRWAGVSKDLSVTIPVRTPAITVRRRAYEQVGGFNPSFAHAADWELLARLAAYGPLWFHDGVLAGYRKHDAADTDTWVRSGRNMLERADVLDSVIPLLHGHDGRQPMRRAMAYGAKFALANAVRLARSGDLRAATIQAGAALASSAGVVNGSTRPVHRLLARKADER